MKIEDIRNEIKVDMGADILSLAISDNTIDIKIKEALRKISSYAPRVLYVTLPASNVIDMPPETTCVVEILTSDATSSTEYVDNDVFSWSVMMQNSGSSMYDPFNVLTLRNQVKTLQGFISLRDWHYDEHSHKLYLSNVQGSVVTVKYMVPYKSVEEITDEIVVQKVKEYALALCKIIEGMIRRKTQSTPGAMQLDGDALVSEGTSEKDKLDTDLPQVFKYLRMGIRV